MIFLSLIKLFGSIRYSISFIFYRILHILEYMNPLHNKFFARWIDIFRGSCGPRFRREFLIRLDRGELGEFSRRNRRNHDPRIFSFREAENVRKFVWKIRNSKLQWERSSRGYRSICCYILPRSLHSFPRFSFLLRFVGDLFVDW